MSYIIAKYLRISDEDVDLDGKVKQESNSIVGQRALLDDFISKTPEFKGCEVIEELDDGRTGTNFARNGAQRLVELAEQGKVQCIIVKDLSRWGRNYIEVGDFLEQKFPAWGVRFISIGDGYDSANLNHGTSGIDVAFRNLIYELYSQDLSVKCRSAKDAAVKTGKVLATYPTFGYVKDPNDRHKFVIDPVDSPIVKRIFNMAEEGRGIAEIAKILNAESVPTKQMSKQRKGFTKQWGRGDLWDNSAVQDTLRNECYTGKWIYGKTRTVQVGSHKTKRVPRSEWIVVDDALPRLISDEQFAVVQEKLDAAFKGHINRKDGSPPRTIFAGLVKCAMCDRVLDFYPRANTSGMFNCKTAKRSNRYDCTTAKIDEADLTEAVLTVLQQQIALSHTQQTSIQDNATQKQKTQKTMFFEIQNLQRLIEQSKQIKIALWEKYRDGSISKEKFQSESEELSKQVNAYESKAAEMTNKIKTVENDTESKLTQRLTQLSGINELTRELVLEFVTIIKVYTPERIEITWKYGDIFEQMLASSQK